MRLPVSTPWSSDFEHRFCDYSQPIGFCYVGGSGTFSIVSSPVHSGRYAAAFTLNTDAANSQARCVRQGVLPTSAYYGAWYFIPELAQNSALWNLIHFQGGEPGTVLQGLWDISLSNGPTGDLEAFVFEFSNGQTYRASTPVPVPIGSWFHLQLYLKRAPDATGEVALYQDGQQLLDLSNLVTDGSSWGQWYVGNLATGLSPSASTLYVDDVTISDTL
jgi:hypothetical protein